MFFPLGGLPIKKETHRLRPCVFLLRFIMCFPNYQNVHCSCLSVWGHHSVFFHQVLLYGSRGLKLISAEMLYYGHTDTVTKHVGELPETIPNSKHKGGSEVRNLQLWLSPHHAEIAYVLLLLSITLLWSHKHNCLLVTSWRHLYTLTHGHTNAHLQHPVNCEDKCNACDWQPSWCQHQHHGYHATLWDICSPDSCSSGNETVNTQFQMSKVLMIHLVHTWNVQATE